MGQKTEFTKPIKELGYDPKSPDSILKHGELLIGKSLVSYLGSDENIDMARKGGLGAAVELYVFHLKPNNRPGPDFTEAGIELKTSPLKKVKNKLVSKERLVMNMIDFMHEELEDFNKSSFWKKNSRLLLIFYLYKKGQPKKKYEFKIVRLWDFPETDLKIIKDDWKTIVKMIASGKAHEITERGTTYLGACTKASNSTKTRPQPFACVPAKPRAYSLKSSYLNAIIDQSLAKKVEPAVKSLSEYNQDESFEDLVVRKFKAWYGTSQTEFASKFNLKSTKAKNFSYSVARRILGVDKKFIEEFQKADIELKTIRLLNNGRLKEAMSFKNIDYFNILKETWDDSVWREILSKRFFFVVFKEDMDGNSKLEKVFFWSMPDKDLESIKTVWMATKEKIANDDFSSFPKSSEHSIAHIRPKGRNSRDLTDAPSGRRVKKYCYWLNREYILKILNKNIV
jgi:DNA mismatch repair protein MutH